MSTQNPELAAEPDLAKDLFDSALIQRLEKRCRKVGFLGIQDTRTRDGNVRIFKNLFEILVFIFLKKNILMDIF